MSETSESIYNRVAYLSHYTRDEVVTAITAAREEGVSIQTYAKASTALKALRALGYLPRTVLS